MKNRIDIIDVTLRDGGFTCDFNWPMVFAQEYYDLMCKLGVSYVELGYWKQTNKSQNRFFDLNMDTIKEVRVVASKLSALKNIKNLPFDANSLSQSKEFEDTNKVFERPSKIDIHITHFMSDDEIKKLAEEIMNV